MTRTDEALRDAVELFKRLNADEEVRRIAEMEELAEAERNEELASSMEAGIRKGKEMGRAEGEKLGLTKGRAEGEKLGLTKGRAEGEKLGLEKGSSAEKRNIAKKLMMQNIDIEIIKITTGLSDKELEKLAV